MRKGFWIGLMVIMSHGLVAAQTGGEHHGYGYGFVAPGVRASDNTAQATLHFGVGGDRLVYKGLGAGGEVGYLGLTRGLGGGVGIVSANSTYNFRNASSTGKLVPFLTGGYSLIFRNDGANGFNIGGGVNYWFKEHVGLRFEVRDHVFKDFGNTHFVGFRIGLAFR